MKSINNFFPDTDSFQNNKPSVMPKIQVMSSYRLPGKRFRTLGIVLLMMTFNGFLFGQSLDEAKKLIENESYNEAIAITNKLLSTDTKDGRNFYYKGLAYYRLAMEEGQAATARTSLLNSAKASFDGGMSRNRKDPYAYIGKALYLIGTDKYDEGKKEINTALEFGAKNVEWLVQASNVYIAAYEFEQSKGTGKGIQARKEDATTQATTLLTKATTVTDKDPQVYIALGNVWYTKKVDELAESNYKKALALNDANVDAHYALSKVLIRQKKYKEAQVELEKVKSLDPKYTNAYKDLADLYYKFNEFKAALKEAQNWKNLIGNDKRARARYATLLYLTNNFEEAVPALTEINKDSSSFILKRLLGYSLTETKKYAEAQQAMDEYFKIVPETSKVFKDYKYYGLILENTNRKEEAIKNYEKAMVQDPSMWELNKNIYNIHKDSKEWKEASKYLEIYVKHQAENKQAPSLSDIFMLAFMFRHSSNLDLDKALTYTEQVLARKPDWVDAIYYSANIKANQDTTGKTAYPIYEKLVKEIHKQSLEEKKKAELKEAYQFLCSYIHIEIKDNPRALIYCEKALELDPSAVIVKKIADFLKGSKVTAKDWKTEIGGN